MTARCVGACGLAPAVIFDGEVGAKMTVQSTLDRTQQWSRFDAR
jgi:bidirectional [NiFe] hydrogenase diaphorase subunit